MSMVWLPEADAGLGKDVLGGKAFGIAKMLRLGLPVPPAFTLTTDECGRFHAAGRVLPADIVASLADGISLLEKATGRGFGDPTRPLLVSVRSGAAQSMPGMMDTILNLGMTDAVRSALVEQSGDAGYAADTARRFAEQYERVVGNAAPSDPVAQLHGAVAAVFDSWFCERAGAYRAHHGVGSGGGTSVTVQAMVFGNLDDASGTGVLFSRNPLTGDPAPYGEWLPRGQGEDVVSGRFDAVPLDQLAVTHAEVHTQLLDLASALEREGRDVQDIEYTVESGRLYLLQTRAAKRSPDAAVRFATLLHDEGLLTADEALAMVSPAQVAALLKPHIDPAARAGAVLLATGEPACPGVGSGLVATDCESAEDLSDEGESVVLARPTTDPDDVSGMLVSAAIVTEVGGATSHAAVVSRELGVPCVVGCGPGVVAVLTGRQVTVDGSTGEIFDGILPLVATDEDDSADLARLAAWARERAPEAAGTLPEILAAAQAVGEMSDVDVLVVGSGAAGLCAALAAVDNGAGSVLVAEASDVVGGSSRLSGGIVMGSRSALQKAAGITEDEDDLFHDYRSLMRWDIAAGPVQRFARASGATVDWLVGHGVPFFERLIVGGEERAPRSHAVDGGGQALVDALHRAATAAGIDVALGRRVDRLLVRDGRVTGIAVGDDEITAGAVVLATGGFGANPERIAELFPSAWDPERTWYIGHDGARGDALDLGASVGAQVTGKDRGLRTLGPGGTFVNEALLPGWIVLLDSDGHRFADETAPYGILDNAVRAHGNQCVALLDSAALNPPPELAERYKSAYKQVWPNHPPFRPRHYTPDMIEFLLTNKRAHTADDLGALAAQVGLDPVAAVGELDRYNSFADAGTDHDFGKAGKFLLPLRTPPFYAVPLWPIAVNLTGAGLRIDDCARVIGADGTPVPGLFAAGECVGGLLGPLYMGSGNALGLATGIGRVAGEEAAREVVGQ